MSRKSALAGKTNSVRVTFRQNLPARVNEQGELIPGSEFQNDVEFDTTTLTELTGKKVGLWMLTVLKHYIKLRRLQGKQSFKMNKHIEVDLSINNRAESFGVKFSLSAKRIENMIEKHPAIVAEAFNTAPAIGQITSATAMKYLTAAEDIVIAKSIKQLAAETSEPVATVNSEMIEEAEVIE